MEKMYKVELPYSVLSAAVDALRKAHWETEDRYGNGSIQANFAEEYYTLFREAAVKAFADARLCD